MQHDFSLFFETDNEYWQKVLDIFAKNEKYEKKVVSNRNLHHKFPRSFSKKLGEPVDNDKDNLISLSLADHFLVHYYYYLLAKKGFRQAMATAFTFMAKKSLKYLTPETAEQVANDYEEAKLIADQFRGNYISKLWEEGRYDDMLAHRDNDFYKESRKKARETFARNHNEEEIAEINYKKGATNRGKTYEEIYGAEKAKELLEVRRKAAKARGKYPFGGKPCGPEEVLIKCVETGEIHTYSEWMKILNVKSKSSLCNVLNNPNKCCRNKHFVKAD